MSFNLVRIGWPNIVPILALAITPAFAMSVDQPQPARTRSFVSAEVCPQPAGRLQMAAIADVLK